MPLPHQPFDVTVHEYHFAGAIADELAIADDLARPLAKLAPADRAFIDQVLAETLNRKIVLARVRNYFRCAAFNRTAVRLAVRQIGIF